MSASWALLIPVAALVSIGLGAFAVLRLQKVPLGRDEATESGAVTGLPRLACPLVGLGVGWGDLANVEWCGWSRICRRPGSAAAGGTTAAR